MSGSNRMSTHCVVPNWNNVVQKHQRQEQVEGDHQQRNTSTSHHHHVQNHSTITNNHILPIPLSNNYQQYCQVKELTWENGQAAMHGLMPSGPSKPIWAQTGGTLESVVHQATCNGRLDPSPNSKNVTTVEKSETRKRARPDSDTGPTKNYDWMTKEEQGGPSGSATFCRDSDTTMLTWPSFESPHNNNSLNNNKPTDEDSVSLGCLENQDEDGETKGESGRSNSTRRSRAAAVHNLSERRRRDRINQKMKALQKLVPNASKSDKASMLDEVIEYLKQLKAQVQMMNNMPAAHMMMPPIWLPSRMGMFDNSFLHSNPLSAGPTFLHPKPVGSPPPSLPLPHPYYAFLAQSMNMELYNKMAAFYSQQVSQSTARSPSRSSQVQPDS